MIDLNRKALKSFGLLDMSVFPSHDVLLLKSSSNLVNLYFVLSTPFFIINIYYFLPKIDYNISFLELSQNL
jgi:hypothetical protein